MNAWRWICSAFRNERRDLYLSLDLIREAASVTRRIATVRSRSRAVNDGLSLQTVRRLVLLAVLVVACGLSYTIGRWT